MALGGSGYFHAGYWHQQYWHVDYWSGGDVVPPIPAVRPAYVIVGDAMRLRLNHESNKTRIKIGGR